MFITDSDVTDQNQLTAKTIERDFLKNVEPLGFMYNLTTSTFLCGVALLINNYHALTDSSCIPDGSDFTGVRIYFGVSIDSKNPPAYFVNDAMKIRGVNVLCLIVSNLN